MASAKLASEEIKEEAIEHLARLFRCLVRADEENGYIVRDLPDED